MRIIRYEEAGTATVRWGAQQAGGSARVLSGDPFSGTPYAATDEPARIGKLLAPVAPPVIFCIGLNYRLHAEETGATIPEYPIVFTKPSTSVQDPGGQIVLPTHLKSDEVDYECELAVVIGKACKNVAAADALSYVAGYTCANDVSARDWQIKKGGSQWCRGKSFDTFCPLGPCLVTSDEIPNPGVLPIRTILNGTTVQESNTDDLIFDVPTLIAFLSGSTTLLPSTVILTGTPSGVGMARKPPLWLKPGDTVTVEIDSIGLLISPVVAEG